MLYFHLYAFVTPILNLYRLSEYFLIRSPKMNFSEVIINDS